MRFNAHSLKGTKHVRNVKFSDEIEDFIYKIQGWGRKENIKIPINGVIEVCMALVMGSCSKKEIMAYIKTNSQDSK